MLVACGCASDPPGGGRSDDLVGLDAGRPIEAPKEGEIGSLCARNGDCDSQQCLQIGRCTSTCRTADECPVSWACDGVAGAGLLCTCAPTGGSETCNGRDDDCDGFADNGATCGDGLVCVAGSCQCPPERACGGSGCTDLANDPDHCGACGNRCGEGGLCSGGACTCGGGLAACGGVCADLATDVHNCGECGRRCGPSSTCTNGTCESGPGGPCASDSDCTNAGECVTEAQGHPGGECINTCIEGFVDCPSGSMCIVAYCYPTCASDADCRSGYVCDWLGTCSVDCRTNPALVCGENVCGASGFCGSSNCTDDSECSSGSYCSGGKCTCSSSTDCGPGRTCGAEGECE